MSKLINQPVELVWENHFPAAFYYQRPYRIKYILNHWRETGQWWLREPERFIYETSIEGMEHSFCELHYLPQKEHWILYRLGNC